MLVDSHVHVSLNTGEPVEMLLMQMQYNGVEKALLLPYKTPAGNSYRIESMRRFPGRFAVACRVDLNSSDAPADLERWRREGAEVVRLSIFERSPGSDPLAIWRKAQELGMSVSLSASGEAEKLSSPEFVRIVEQLPDLKFVFEHLAGMGLNPRPTEAVYREALKLANYPNTYIKIHGMEEICPMPRLHMDVPPPVKMASIPPYVKMAYDAFGARRMMWGSNWPPVTTQEGYRNALNFTMDQLSYCSKDDLDWIFGKTALSIWKFP